MAKPYKRGRLYWGRVTRNGKDYRFPLETESKSVAESRLAKRIAELEASSWGERPRITVQQASDRFIREHGPTLKPNSVIRYTQSLEFVCARLGGVYLDQVGRAELKDYEMWRRSAAGVTASTIRRDLAALSSLFGHFMETEELTTNPVPAFLRAGKKRGLKESPPRTRYLTEEEEAALLAACTPLVRSAAAFALGTGLRREEQFGLTWDRVNLSRREIVIPAEMAKSRRDRRVVMLPQAIEVCQHATGRRFVFEHEDGNRFGKMQKGFQAAVRRAGLSDLRWHDLRRTHGCRLLQKWDWSMEMVRDQLGHASIDQTQRAYAFLEVEDRHRRTEAAQLPAHGAQNQTEKLRVIK